MTTDHTPYADIIAVDQHGAIILDQTILNLLNEAPTMTPTEIHDRIYSATGHQALVSPADVRTTLHQLLQANQIAAADASTSRYTIIRHLHNLSHPNGAPFLQLGDTATIVTGQTGIVTRIYHLPNTAPKEFLVNIEGIPFTVHYSAINHVQPKKATP